MMGNPEHYEYRVQINRYLLNAELNVTFAGAARPLPRHKVGPAVYNYILIHSVDHGYGTFEWQRKKHRLGQGDIFIIFPGVLFSYEADNAEPWSYRWIALQGRCVTEMLENIGVTPIDPIVRGANSVKLASIFETIEHELEHKSGETITTLATDGWFRVLLAEFARLNANKLHYSPDEVLTDSERVVEQAIRWFQTQYMLPISIEKLATSLGYHRTHFTKVFKQLTSLSPKQYINQVRMERAKELLNTNISIEQVGNSCGFSDPLYFSKQFKKWTGISPTQYRDELKRSYKDRF
ncbi:AraC family transcriptional regulator [Paenibacillus polymyxa]|nr:AraC family transcriptional regulator [Paenibacillus polymyxa]